MAHRVSRPVRSFGGGEVAQAHFAILRHIKNAVGHRVHRIAKSDEIAHGGPEKRFRLVACKVGQNDHPRMDGLLPDEFAEVLGVLCDQDEVLVDAAVQHTMVWFAQATVVARMEHDMVTLVVESEDNLWGNALVEEQSHSSGDVGARARLGWSEIA